MENNYEHIYIAIDLKSFYASVECIERGLNPLTTNLVVADKERTEKTVCLAVTPSLKQYKIPGRARLYEVVQKVKELNDERVKKTPCRKFTGSSYDDKELEENIELAIDYIVAVPRMSYYMQYSTKIVDIYLKWFSMEDIYIYSIDEVFIDVTNYLKMYDCTPRELATKVINDVLEKTGITATCGIGTNMYLCKVAMDIVAKHIEPDKNGVRIAGLDEMAYRKFLWSHKPMTDFWRIGKGIANRLIKNGMYTMGDVARQSLKDDEKLYKMFGVNAELIIDHAWGYEPCTIKSIKSYRPVTSSISLGQVLTRPYSYSETKIIVKEMAELLSLDLVKKDLITSKLVLEIGYDVKNITNPKIKACYNGETTEDRYGRKIPKHAHGTINIDHKTSSSKIIIGKFEELYDRIINKDLLTRRITVVAQDVVNEDNYKNVITYEQMNLFIDYDKLARERQKERGEKMLQKTLLDIKEKYGKNAILKGMNFLESGTTRQRNRQIGGHRS